jgi:hypothetical protein
MIKKTDGTIVCSSVFWVFMQLVVILILVFERGNKGQSLSRSLIRDLQEIKRSVPYQIYFGERPRTGKGGAVKKIPALLPPQC